MRFTDVQSVAPWTIPSVATVLTGLYPIQHGAGAFSSEIANLDDQVPSSLRKGVPTLARRFVDLGVPAHAVVAHPWFKSGFGLGNGFPAVEFRAPGSNVVKAAEAWLSRLIAEKPASGFFLYLHFMEAHQWHMTSGDDLKSRLAATPQELRETAKKNAPAGICRDPESTRCERYQVYVHAIAQERAYLAQVLDFLTSQGLIADTTVVVYSDHGEEFADHLDAERRLAVDPRGYYGIGHGQSLFQELLHVPVLIWRPGVHGHEVESAKSLAAFPHLLSRWFDLSLPPLVQVETSTDSANRGARDALFSSAMAFGPQAFSVRSGNWKLIEYPTLGVRRLFDLSSDPDEKHPLENAAVERSLSALLADYQALPGMEPGERPHLEDKQLEQLRSLGYLTETDGAHP